MPQMFYTIGITALITTNIVGKNMSIIKAIYLQ